MANDQQCCEVPLTEQLRSVPIDYRTCVAIQWAEDGTETGHQFIPVGFMMHRAADEIDRLSALPDRASDEGAHIVQVQKPEFENRREEILWKGQNYDALLDKITVVEARETELRDELATALRQRHIFRELTDRAIKMMWLAIPETREPVSESSHNPITAWVAAAHAALRCATSKLVKPAAPPAGRGEGEPRTGVIIQGVDCIPAVYKADYDTLRQRLAEMTKGRDDALWTAAHREEMFKQREQLMRDLQTATMAAEQRAAQAEALLAGARKDVERLDWLERNHHFNGASEGGDFYRWEFSTINNAKQWEPIRSKLDGMMEADAALDQRREGEKG